MCGVFGFVAHGDGGPSLKTLEKIATATMRRGPHAFGFAWIDRDDRLCMYKQTGRIVDSLGILRLIVDAKMAIGHCRYATHGDPANNLNNHPHPSDGGWIVHNGVIRDYQDAIELNDLHPVSSCDSEVLGLLIERLDGPVLRRSVDAVTSLDRQPLVMLGLWSRPNRLVVIRQDNPLHISATKGATYLASLAEGMPGQVHGIRNDSARQFSQKGIRHADLYPSVA